MAAETPFGANLFGQERDDTGALVSLGQLAGAVLARLVPVGGCLPWTGTAAPPAPWLLADGTVKARTAYPILFAAIGTTYNTGGEAGTDFRLPNLKGRAVVGQDAAQTEFDTLGETGGAKTHTLSLAESPSHDHGGASGSGGAHTPTIQTGGDHQHTVNAGLGGGDVGLTPGISNYNLLEQTKTTSANGSHAHTADAVAAHTHTVSAAGSGGAHNNLQPYIALPWMVRAA